MDRNIQPKTFTAKRIILVITGVAVITAVGLAVWHSGGERRFSVKADTLRIATVERGPFREFIPVEGSVQPLQEYILDAVEGGKVEQVYQREGAMVHRGDPLLKLSNSDLALDYLYRETQLLEQRNQLRNSHLEMEQSRLTLQAELMALEHEIQQQQSICRRNEDLHQDKLISQAEYEQARDQLEYLQRKKSLTVKTHQQALAFRQAQSDQIQSTVHQMEANLALLRQKMDDLVVRAPADGQLTALNAEVGQTKPAGERLGQLDVLDGFKVRAWVDEFYLSRVDTGLQGVIDLDSTPYTLTVHKIYPEVRDGRFELEMRFAGPAPTSIKRGQTLKIRLQLGDQTEALLLPRGGFYQSTGGQWAFVLNADGHTARRRPIRLGRQNPLQYEVLDGLKPGDRVIISGYDTFGETTQLVLN